MSDENLRAQLEIDTKLELMKEHKCCAESILCIETYMYRLEQENQQLKEQNECLLNQKKDFEYIQAKTLDNMNKKNEQLKKSEEVIDEAIEYIENRIVEDDYMLKTDTKMVQGELLEILQRYKGDTK